MKDAQNRDDFSKLLMLSAYYKTGNLDNAMNILKEMDRKRWKSKKVKKIVENWKVKMLLTSPYQLNQMFCFSDNKICDLKILIYDFFPGFVHN